MKRQTDQQTYEQIIKEPINHPTISCPSITKLEKKLNQYDLFFKVVRIAIYFRPFPVTSMLIDLKRKYDIEVS